MIHKIKIPVTSEDNTDVNRLSAIDMSLVNSYTEGRVGNRNVECTIIDYAFGIEIICRLTFKQFDILHEEYMNKTIEILKNNADN